MIKWKNKYIHDTRENKGEGRKKGSVKNRNFGEAGGKEEGKEDKNWKV